MSIRNSPPNNALRDSLSVLIVEDDPALQSLFGRFLQQRGYVCRRAISLSEARTALDDEGLGFVLLDVRLPDGDGLDLLDEMRERALDIPTIVMTAHDSVGLAVEAMRRGAVDFLPKPVDVGNLDRRMAAALEARQTEVRPAGKAPGPDPAREPEAEIRAYSPEMKQIMEQARRMSRYEQLPVLILGETGTGKEVFARLLHESSPRASKSLVAVNCATLDRELLRSELFGHEKGAFTGATEQRRGLFELAGDGTLFLDEIGDMPMETQAAFLRVLETRRFRRLGGTSEIETGARIIAATNRPLHQLVREGKFREDLLYRLNTLELRLPPLRKRTGEIAPLAEHFCEAFSARTGVKASLTKEAIAVLERYSWPGNVRELRHAVERAVVEAAGGDVRAEHLLIEEHVEAATERATATGNTALRAVPTGVDEILPLEEIERRHIGLALSRCGGNKTRAAEILGISRNTLLRKLNREQVA